MANESSFDNSITSGRTGVVTNTTAYAVLCAGTSATNPIQSIAALGNANQVLTSNGASALPTFQDPGASGTAVCKVWASLNGTGSIALHDSYNISGTTDNGTGDYTFTIDTDFASANYAITSITSNDPSTPAYCTSTVYDTGTARAAGAFRIYCALTGAANTLRDTEFMDIACFGDQ